MSNIQENKNKRDEFVKSQKVQLVDLSNVILTERIHIKAKANFTDLIEKFKSNNIKIDKPIMIRQLEDGQYSLVMGYQGYMIAKGLEQQQIPCVIVEAERKQLVNELNIDDGRKPKGTQSFVPIDKVKIPKDFQRTKPREEKLDACRLFVKKYKMLDKPVTIKGKELIDGYIRYLIALEKGYKWIPVRFVS